MRGSAKLSWAQGTYTLRASANGHGRDAVFELEQAGDSAKVAAEADGGAAEATTSSVLDAHLAICMLKAEIG